MSQNFGSESKPLSEAVFKETVTLNWNNFDNLRDRSEELFGISVVIFCVWCVLAWWILLSWVPGFTDVESIHYLTPGEWKIVRIKNYIFGSIALITLLLFRVVYRENKASKKAKIFNDSLAEIYKRLRYEETEGVIVDPVTGSRCEAKESCLRGMVAELAAVASDAELLRRT